MKHQILQQMEYPFQAWTDYPIKKNEEGKPARIRKISITAYDGDKYCTVRYKNKKYKIKSGYIYPYPTNYAGQL